jgi:hypothetical protein
VQGAPWLNTLYFGTAGTAANAVAAVGAFWGAVDAFIANDISWATLPDVDEIGVDGSLTGIDSVTPATGTGTDTAEMLPFASQVSIRWRTGAVIGGRELKGKTYIPGLCTASLDDGLLDSGAQAAIQTAADNLIGDVNSSFVIWSRVHAQQLLVAAATVDSDFAVLRSRRD